MPGTPEGLEFSPGVKRRTLAKRVGIAVAVVAVLAAVAYGVGSFTLMGNLNGKLALKGLRCRQGSHRREIRRPVLYARRGRAGYARVCPTPPTAPMRLPWCEPIPRAKTSAFISIPADVQVSLKDGKYYPIRQASVRESDASLVSAVASFADVKISHVVKIDAARPCAAGEHARRR